MEPDHKPQTKVDEKFDAWQLLLWFYIACVPIGGSIKDALTTGINFDEGIRRLGAIAIVISAIKGKQKIPDFLHRQSEDHA